MGSFYPTAVRAAETARAVASSPGFQRRALSAAAQLAARTPLAAAAVAAPAAPLLLPEIAAAALLGFGIEWALDALTDPKNKLGPALFPIGPTYTVNIPPVYKNTRDCQQGAPQTALCGLYARTWVVNEQACGYYGFFAAPCADPPSYGQFNEATGQGQVSATWWGLFGSTDDVTNPNVTGSVTLHQWWMDAADWPMTEWPSSKTVPGFMPLEAPEEVPMPDPDPGRLIAPLELPEIRIDVGVVEQPWAWPLEVPALRPLPRAETQPGVSIPIAPPVVITLIRPGARPSVSATPVVPKPPPPGTKERKIRVGMTGALRSAVNALTEGRDFVDGLHKALRDEQKTKKTSRLGLTQKIRDLYNAWASVDEDYFRRALIELIENQLKDFFYGRAGQKYAQAAGANPYYKRPVGFQFGDRYRPRAPRDLVPQDTSLHDFVEWAVNIVVMK